MHRNLLMILAVAVISLAASVDPGLPPVEYVSVEKLLSQKTITAKVSGLGGFQQECVQFEIENNQQDTVSVRIEAGRRLVTTDSSMQNILLVREDTIRLAPKEKITHNVYGFCCNASRHSPSAGAEFTVGYLAEPPLRKLAVYLSKNSFDVHEMQSAVWAVSNNHSIAGIGDAENPKTIKLREFVAKVIGKSAPWYNVVFKKDSTLCSGVAERVIGKFGYQVTTNGFVTLLIVDEKGMPRKMLLNNVAHNPDSYTKEFNLDVADWPEGTYHMRLFIDGVRKIDKTIEL